MYLCLGSLVQYQTYYGGHKNTKGGMTKNQRETGSGAVSPISPKHWTLTDLNWCQLQKPVKEGLRSQNAGWDGIWGLVVLLPFDCKTFVLEQNLFWGHRQTNIKLFSNMFMCLYLKENVLADNLFHILFVSTSTMQNLLFSTPHPPYLLHGT